MRKKVLLVQQTLACLLRSKSHGAYSAADWGIQLPPGPQGKLCQSESARDFSTGPLCKWIRSSSAVKKELEKWSGVEVAMQSRKHTRSKRAGGEWMGKHAIKKVAGREQPFAPPTPTRPNYPLQVERFLHLPKAYLSSCMSVCTWRGDGGSHLQIFLGWGWGGAGQNSLQ